MFYSGSQLGTALHIKLYQVLAKQRPIRLGRWRITISPAGFALWLYFCGANSKPCNERSCGRTVTPELGRVLVTPFCFALFNGRLTDTLSCVGHA